MGTWGPGNFENDAAAEYLQELCQPMLDQIEAAVKEASLLEPDEYDSEIMMCNIEILACWSEHLGRFSRSLIQDALYPCVLPPPTTVAEWHRIYLEVWDGYIDQIGPSPDYKRDRRSVIVDSFQRLERIAAAQHEED